MKLVFAMIISIGIKAISAIIEIAIQMLITNCVGFSEYGNYTFLISLVEGAYFLLFSGSIKLNTFYLSTPAFSLMNFKKRFNVLYVFPLITVIIVAFAIMKNLFGVTAGIILLLYYFAYEESSTFLSRGYQLPALLGEYLIGRIVFLIGLIFVIRFDNASTMVVFVLYGLQFATMLLWFVPFKNKLKKGSEEIHVPLRKLIEFQISDVATSLIYYFPNIVQYVFGGAVTAGFAGIVSLVKKFIGFISGPTAKVFLPEFSRLYKNGENEKLERSYLMIVRIQMVFIGTIGAVLIGFPNLILHMFSQQLEQYSSVFTGTAISLLIISGIGPVTGILQMTGNERVCNRNQWISIVAMVLTCVCLHKETLFAVYGLCVQALVEGAMKYFSVCHWFGKNIVPVKSYLLSWLPVVLLFFLIDRVGWQYSYLALLISALFAFLWNAFFALQDPMVKKVIIDKFGKRI